jgi:hypothetical protein
MPTIPFRTRPSAIARGSAAALALAAGLLAGPAAAVDLVMVEQPGCHYCARWHAEIGPAWPNTAAGAHAPLRHVMLRNLPDDLSFERRVTFTPTFVVVDDDGAELGRLEGYPGADFFWPMIEALLAETSGFDP